MRNESLSDQMDAHMENRAMSRALKKEHEYCDAKIAELRAEVKRSREEVISLTGERDHARRGCDFEDLADGAALQGCDPAGPGELFGGHGAAAYRDPPRGAACDFDGDGSADLALAASPGRLRIAHRTAPESRLAARTDRSSSDNQESEPARVPLVGLRHLADQPAIERA